MKTNLIKAILYLLQSQQYQILNMDAGRNRINNQGRGLEEFIIDLFCGTVDESNEQLRIIKRNELFSYLGNQNNPPDAMIKEGDAIEVKKIETTNAALALNSSYPKAKLLANNPMLSKQCVECENWTEKDMIYAIGEIDKQNSLRSLSFVYGEDYAASLNTYERIKSKIKDGILTIDDVEFSETKELGRVNRVDPLGITNLRIRGMWHIENPLKVFNYIYQPKNVSFNFMALINFEKYFTFCEDDRNRLELAENEFDNLEIKNVKIKLPDNPAQLSDAKLITFSI